MKRMFNGALPAVGLAFTIIDRGERTSTVTLAEIVAEVESVRVSSTVRWPVAV